MRIRIVKRWKPADTGDMLKAWERKYGSLNSLQHKVLISKCTAPEMMADLVMWKHLSQGAEFIDVIVMNDSDIFDTLSSRRMELLEYLLSNEVRSIRHLATALRRNYKNVYDDLNALSKYGLVELVAAGRSLRPSASASRVEISFEG